MRDSMFAISFMHKRLGLASLYFDLFSILSIISINVGRFGV